MSHIYGDIMTPSLLKPCPATYLSCYMLRPNIRDRTLRTHISTHTYIHTDTFAPINSIPFHLNIMSLLEQKHRGKTEIKIRQKQNHQMKTTTARKTLHCYDMNKT